MFPTSNHSQTNLRNVEKICFQAICEVKFSISLAKWGFKLKKLKLGRDSHVDGALRKILKHQTEVDNSP